MTTRTTLLLLQRAYVLSTKKPGRIVSRANWSREEGDIHSEQVSDITAKPVGGRSDARLNVHVACSIHVHE
jgi:hypothetical protein